MQYNREYTYERKVNILQVIVIILLVFFFYSVIIALSDSNAVRHDNQIDSEMNHYINQ